MAGIRAIGTGDVTSLLATEAAEAPARIATALSVNREGLAALGRRLSADPPRILLTAARGSSDAAALWLRALTETELGWPTGSLAPSTISIYGADVRLDGALVVLISQSGAGPDLLAVAEHARARGALTVGMVNDVASPLASVVEIALALSAGPELSIAATKPCLSAFALSTALVDACQPDVAGETADLPDYLARSSALDWTAMADFLSGTQSAYVVARGPGLAIATEAALKLKEVTGIHAEVVSAAELIHGPLALAGAAMPALLFNFEQLTDASVREAATRLRTAGSPILTVGLDIGADSHLPTAPTGTPGLRAMGALQAFYMALPAIAERRGRDPDAPPGLKKVTRTL